MSVSGCRDCRTCHCKLPEAYSEAGSAASNASRSSGTTSRCRARRPPARDASARAIIQSRTKSCTETPPSISPLSTLPLILRKRVATWVPQR
eukprot:2198809-Prymnesium_polylepis.1